MRQLADGAQPEALEHRVAELEARVLAQGELLQALAAAVDRLLGDLTAGERRPGPRN